MMKGVILHNVGRWLYGRAWASSVSCQQVDDDLVIERLGEVVVEVGFVCPPPVVVPGVGRDDDEQDTRPVLAAESPGEFIAVDVGQPHIEQGHIGAELPGDFQGPTPVEGDRDLVPLELQEPRATQGDVTVIIDHQYATLAYLASVYRGLPVRWS